MFLNYYGRLCTVFIFFAWQSSHTLSVFNRPEHKLETEIRLILDRHNQYRTCHHTPPLVVDPRLTREAQSIANALANERTNSNQARKWRQENIFSTQWNLQLDELFAMNENPQFSFNPVDKWYSEIKFYLDDKSRTDHFTRIVWKETKKLGVGIAQNDKGFVYIVCKYDPEGNIPGSYEKNVIIPDVKMIHASDVCILSPMMTSLSEKKDNTRRLQTSTVTYETNSTLEPATIVSTSDYKITSIYGQQASSTVTYDHPNRGDESSIVPSTTDSVRTRSSPHLPRTSSATTNLTTSFGWTLVGPVQTATTIDPSHSATESETSTHLGSIIWNRKMLSTSTIMPGSLSTIGILSTVQSTSTPPFSLQDLLTPTTPSPAIYPSEPVFVTPSPFSSYESSTPTPILVDIFPTVSSQSESKSEKFVSSATAPYIGTMEPFANPLTSTPPEFEGHKCNWSDATKTWSCYENRPPQDTDHDTQIITPSPNQTTADWFYVPKYKFPNQAEDDVNPFDKSEDKAEYLRFTLLFMGLLVASISAAVSLLAVFALFKLFVCCSRARNGKACQDAPSSPAAQTPSNLVSTISTTNPRPISPTRSRPGSPVYPSPNLY